MNSLNYLIKNDLYNELDNLIIKELKFSLEYDGLTCKKCGSVQGTAQKGVKKYYCEHISARIDKKLKKESEEITQRAFLFMLSSVYQRDL